MSFITEPGGYITTHQGESGFIEMAIPTAMFANLVGLTITLKAAKSFSSPAVLTLVIGSGITVTGNNVRIDFTKSNTSLMRPGEYFYQVDINDGAEMSKILVDSTITVLPQVK